MSKSWFEMDTQERMSSIETEVNLSCNLYAIQGRWLMQQYKAARNGALVMAGDADILRSLLNKSESENARLRTELKTERDRNASINIGLRETRDKWEAAHVRADKLEDAFTAATAVIDFNWRHFNAEHLDNHKARELGKLSRAYRIARDAARLPQDQPAKSAVQAENERLKVELKRIRETLGWPPDA